MSIYCKECEHEVYSGNDPVFAEMRNIQCGACGSDALLMSQDEYDRLQASRDTAKLERKKQRRNADQRARYSAMRSLGLKRTPYGWE